MENEYLSKSKQKLRLWYFIAIFLLFLTSIFGLMAGGYGFEPSMLSSLFFENDNSLIVREIRLPRILAAILGGSLLGISGALMQGVLKNPLASPLTLGISQAAAFGASFAIIVLQVFQSELVLVQNIGVIGLAFLASFSCMIGVLWLGSKTKMSPSTLILSGVALGSLFHAATMLLQFFASDLDAAASLFWTFGSLDKVTWPSLYIMGVVGALLILPLYKGHWKLDALGFGDDSAYSMGVEVKKYRAWMLFWATLSASVVVSYFGIIGFVGLVAPHLARLLVGYSYKVVFPFSSLFGAILLLFADILSRTISPPLVLPVGIITSFMGVPMLLYLLAKRGTK